MKKLQIVRHGKSSWDFIFQDHDRPLLEKGIQNSIKIADASKNEIDTNSLIMSSSAVRALSTAKIMVAQWDLSLHLIQVRKDLYTFDCSKLEAIIKSCPDTYDSIILFGHNHAITDFVTKFGDIFIDNVPTSGLVSLIFDTNSWTTISKGKTQKMLFPREI